jgi:beta-galactosidase
MKVESRHREKVSRRKFLKAGTLATAGIAYGAVWGLSDRQALASAPNGPSTLRYSLDQNWLFGGKLGANATTSEAPDAAFSRITLPHCVAKLSWHKWNPADWESVWMYRRHLTIPKELAGRRIFLKFDGAMVNTTPTFNGHALTRHVGGYLPFTYELTSIQKPGDNILDVTLDSNFLNVPPDGNPKGTGSVDYYTPGGIFRSVSLCAMPQVFVSDVFAKPVDVLMPTRHVDVLCTIDAAAAASSSFEVKVDLMDGSHLVSTTSKKLTVTSVGKMDVSLTLSNLGNVKLWDVDNPHLYTVVATLLMDEKPLHDYKTRIGFREASFTADGFFLNGRRLTLFGLNRHEVYPYVGMAMPPRVMRRDAEIVRHDLNCNMVRCSHYPQNEAFLDACDELGLMVWQEPPGWGYLGADKTFQDIVHDNVRDMVLRDRNHASIIIWGVRVNESRNDLDLYARTGVIAKQLDGSRPTSGSMTNFRNWQTEWNSDVFAMDDYHTAEDGTLGVYPPLPGVPYMLAETVGQFSYGDKGFHNPYYRNGDLMLQCDQAIFHAQAHDRAAAYPRFCGVVAWCAFEYPSPQNSHEGIKNPGVSDVFRIPKLGASFYLAQVSPNIRSVIAPNFYWDFGAKSPRGPGKNSAIFSNCDRLEVFVDGKPHATAHPDKTNYPNTKYPPFFVDLDLDGTAKPELRIDGYVADKLAVSQSFSADSRQDKFVLTADDAEIVADGSDATRLIFKVVDKFGMYRLLAGGDVKFDIAGPGVLVGDSSFSLTDSGGVGAVWIKAVPNSTGTITVHATHSSLGTRTVMIKAKRGTESFLS